jgi:hypothetical protein
VKGDHNGNITKKRNSKSDYENALNGLNDDEGFIALVRRGQNTFFAVVKAE